MGNINVSTVTGKNNQPVNFPTGISIGVGVGAGTVNHIGLAGQQGFGLGICPGPLPAGMSEMPGTRTPTSDNYGNYIYSDGSVMIWMPAFYYKYGTGANGLALNDVDVKAFSDYQTVGAANAAGYALHRAFYDGGAVQAGCFVDKYQCSNNGGIASSLRLGNPLSSSTTHNPFSLVGAANTYAGAIDAAKSRGVNFFCNSRFIFSALALLSVAHGQAATSTTWCAWYDAAGITNYPKGNNNNALGDANDAAISYISDGYPNAGKTGSANLFSRTTHNGQNSGVCDLNGNMWEVSIGLTLDATNYFLLNPSVSMKTLTSGNTLAADVWGAASYAANYTNLGTSYASLWATGVNRATGIGSATAQSFSSAVSGSAWNAAGAGIPLATGGSNKLGNDGLWDYKLNELCPLAGGYWNNAALAGLWALHLGSVRGYSNSYVGCRSALYL